MILFLCCVMLVVGTQTRNDTLDGGFESSSGGDYDDDNVDYELVEQENDYDDDYDMILQKIGAIDET